MRVYLKLQPYARSPRLRWVMWGGLIVLGVYLLHCSLSTYTSTVLEFRFQAKSWAQARKMFAENENTVRTSYEHLLPRAGNLTALDAVWQNVSGTSNKFFVYSAYYERRSALGRSVRVIGATRTYDSDAVWCRLWYHTEPPQSVSVMAQIKIIHEHWRLPYSPCFVLCPLGEGMLVPQSVSIVRRLDTAPTNRLQVIDNFQQPTGAQQYRPGQLAVCVKPMHSFNEQVNLVEFFEFYRLLGVEHFTLYDHTVSPASRCILDQYARQDLVTVLPWQLDLVSHVDIHTEGIFASLNDCLYRNMYRYKMVVAVDFDEFIIPKKGVSLVELVELLDENSSLTRPSGAYIFKNAFFLRQRPNDPSLDNSLQSQLITLSKTDRNVYLHPYNTRSKYICKPELVAEIGNHFVWEYMPGVTTNYVKPSIALSQHYRKCTAVIDCIMCTDACADSVTVRDRTAHRYKDSLSGNVFLEWRDIQEQCNLPELAK